MDESQTAKFNSAEEMKALPLNRSANFLETLTKRVAMQSALNMCQSRGYQELIYANTSVNVLILDKLLTVENRMKYPSANHTEWIPLNQVAVLLKKWATGENRPEHGSFVGFR